MNLGIATGIFGTLIAATPAGAAEPPERSGNTRELPMVPSGFIAPSGPPDTATAAEGLHHAAMRFELQGEEDRASAWAASQARTDKEAAQNEAARQEAARQEADRRKAAADQEARKAAAAKREASRKAAAKQPAQGKAGSGAGASGAKLPATGRNAVADFARGKIGSAYVYGASSGRAFDCSGLVQAAYRAAGISVPRTSQAQSGAYAEVRGELKPGDILYWGAKGSAYHVAVYVGGGKFVGAQNPGKGVVLRDVAGSGYTGAVRPG
ncbi:C40 family peptidase [Streptomyces sp. NPDC059104]|uniref:C40 family peptidase n=1 Tax=Streptomyces sp. NPDC059104 TaxID=3346729 RepID=UPI0036AE1C53